MLRSNPEFWGRAGAGILFTCEEDNTVFLMHRSRYVEQPGTWGIPGGSVSGEGFFDSEMGAERPTDDVFWAGAQQETLEECGGLPEGIEVVDTIDFVSGSFVYRNFICNISLASKLAWTPTIELNWENDGFDWFDFGDFPSGTHFGVDYILEKGFSLPRRSNPARGANIDAFFEDYEARTHPNVLSPRQRIYVLDNGDFAALELTYWDGKVMLDSISVPPEKRDQGAGNAVMLWLTHLADQHNVDMRLIAKQIGRGGLNTQDLVEWYKFWGFEIDPTYVLDYTEGVDMVRYANP